MTDRAVSVTVNYVMTITIATLLLSGLAISAGGLIQSQSERAIESELEVLGQQLAADIESTDRLATVAGGANAEVRIETRLPTRVAGTGYDITVVKSELVLRSTDPAISVTVPLTVTNDLAEGRTIQGGDVVIVWSTETDRLEVESA